MSTRPPIFILTLCIGGKSVMSVKAQLLWKIRNAMYYFGFDKFKMQLQYHLYS